MITELLINLFAIVPLGFLGLLPNEPQLPPAVVDVPVQLVAYLGQWINVIPYADVLIALGFVLGVEAVILTLRMLVKAYGMIRGGS